MKVLALTKYSSLAAGTRQRFLQYQPALEAAGIDLHCSPLFGNDYLVDVLAGRRASRASIAAAYWRRLKAIANTGAADVVWLHCEFLPYWPGAAESFAARVIGKPILFDFDDAIFHMYDAGSRWPARLLLEGKLEPLLRRVEACACGNAYLRDYAMQYCANSIILPTVVDTTVYRPAAERPARPVTIGWIGSPSTWPNVRPLLPLLEELARTQGIRVRVVGAGRAVESDRFPGLDIVEWSEASEVADVQAMDIGIMPLRDRPFERGKSGYKLIQYMACGLPTVASPIGVNSEIVEDGTTGLLASGNEEWRGALTRLIGNPDLRRSFGLAGRRKAEARYSLAAQASRLIDLLRSVGAC